MKRRTFVAGVTATGISLMSGPAALAQERAGTATPAEGETMMQTDVQSGYAPVNGLDMYYEIHGAGGVPLLVIHGAFGNTGLFGGELVPALAETRTVIVMDQQAHGRTADIDRPLSVVQMADDTAALVEHLGLDQVDVFGYSMGGGIAFRLAVERPELVRKLVIDAVYTSGTGVHPEIVSGMKSLSPEVFAGSPMETSYLAVAPNPDDWPALVDEDQGAWQQRGGLLVDAGRGSGHRGAGVVHHRRLGHRPSGARGRGLPPARRRCARRSYWITEVTAGHSARHDAHRGDPPNRSPAGHDRAVPRRSDAGGAVTHDPETGRR
jgi:pimeloyl-ACP methyl ester carboxylesterase